MRVVLVLVLAMGAACESVAEPLPDPENGRYAFSQMSDATLRLDTRTGAVSICRRKPAGWTCEAVADDRTALEAEIARLQAENGGLKKELIGRGIALPGVRDGAAPEKPRERELRLPSDADVDRMMTFLEKVWRRLIDMVQRVHKDLERKG